MRKHLAPLTIVALALTACGSTGNIDTSAPSASSDSSVSASAQIYKGIKDWSATDELGTSYIVTTGIEAPNGVLEARELIGVADQKLHYLAITVDNRQGTAEANINSIAFTNPAGDLIEYTILSPYLNYLDAKQELSTDASNRVIEVHNAFSGDDYRVAAGEKKTLILASETAVPEEVTHATLNSLTALAPSQQSTETGKATGAPEPSEPVGSNDALANLRGTTLKGNDIRFYIYSPNYQKELNDKMPEQLKGSWGALCSVAAAESQLNETGALTGGGHVWRSLNYAQAEAGVPGLDSEADYKAYEAVSLLEGGSEKCVLVQAVDLGAAVKTDTATIGQYVGTSELVNTVEVS